MTMNPHGPADTLSIHSDAMTKTIRVELGARLVREIPRFFGGPRAAFRELFQNAWRAGAKHIEIHLDGNTLVFQDDGCGCPNPEVLLAAGETGWNEAITIEPAGLGFFSLLSKDVSATVEVQSRGWRVNLVPDHVLAQKPVLIEEGEFTGKGMRIALVLVQGNVEADLKEARGYYPFTVHFNSEEMPPTSRRAEMTIPTRVGEVGIRRREHREHSEAIWEYRLVQGSNFEESLSKAAEDDVQKAIVRDYRVEWVVDPRSGVRPKLPDRNDIEQSPALLAAARAILATIEAHLTEIARTASATWPETVDPWEGTHPRWLVSTATGKAILARLGWHEVTWTEWDETQFYYVENEGWRQEWSHQSVFTRAYVRVKEERVARSMNAAIDLGADLPYALLDRDTGLPVHVEGHRRPKEGLWVGLATDITLGTHRLPFLLGTREEAAEVVLACDPDSATAAVMGHSVALPSLEADVGETIAGYLATYDRDSLHNLWGDKENDCLDTEKVAASLLVQIGNDFVGEPLATARRQLHTLKEARTELYALALVINPLARSKDLRGTKCHALAAALAETQMRLDTRIKHVERRAKLPK